MSATIVVCAHNEESYIGDCLCAILQQTVNPKFVVVVADRCADRTVSIARKELANQKSLIVEKTQVSWRNSISENLQIGFSRATGDALVVVDADIIIPRHFLQKLLTQLSDFAVVSAVVRTDPSQGPLNRLVSIWELTYGLTPLAEQPRGGARAISMEALKEIGGIRDVYAWESDLDRRLRRAGFKVGLDRSMSVLHRRKMTVARSIAYQIQAGRARRELGISLLRTFLHSVIRLRPFVMVGYLGS